MSEKQLQQFYAEAYGPKTCSVPLIVLTDDEIERRTVRAVEAQAPVEFHEPKAEIELQNIDIDVNVPMFDVEVSIETSSHEEIGIFSEIKLVPL